MTLNDMLRLKRYNLSQVLVMRHRPRERELNKVLPWLAGYAPHLFNAYQQTQGARVEKAMKEAEYVASFIRYPGKRALFIGLYKKTDEKTLTRGQYWQIPAHIEMRDKYGMTGFGGDDKRDTIQWFDLEPDDRFYPEWRGKLVIDWPEPAIAYCRRANKSRNVFPVWAVLDESPLDAGMPPWDQLVLDWHMLELLPERWKASLNEWRVIYYIFDTSICKGYVGSASGIGNLFQRWSDYAATGHGGNVQLRTCDPRNFQFTILQRMSPDADPEEVARLEASWKKRLHTRYPHGLNDN